MNFERSQGRAKKALEEITGSKLYTIEGKWDGEVWVVECLDLITHERKGYLHSLNKNTIGIWMLSEKKEHLAAHFLKGGQ